jgi:quercetin dioxygenase-like cupin family protein/quinol monooxygenase YgiN
MYGTLFKAVAKAGKRDELLKFLIWDAQVADRTEPNTLRFDVWPVSGEPDAVYVYEAYSSVKGFEAHKAHAPYQQFVSHIEQKVLDPGCQLQIMDWTHSIASNDDDRPGSSEHAPASELLTFDDFPVNPTARPNFDGEAVLRRLTMRRNASVALVQFERGVRTHWHHHGGDQLLWFIEGMGTITVREADGTEGIRTTSPGDMVRIRSGVRHRHGASEASPATHVAITIGTTVWEEPTASGRAEIVARG